jgi:predicted RNase H-like nuclease (RuvC/YqgF family)
MAYSIREAAEAAGVSKSTIQRRLKEGDISRNADGKIDPSELARVYPDSVKVSLDHGQNTVSGTLRDTQNTGDEHTEISILKAELEAARKLAEERDRELGHRDETIRDLRQRLDKEGEERRQLTVMLTDQRTKKRKGFFGRLVDS